LLGVVAVLGSDIDHDPAPFAGVGRVVDEFVE